jgi:Signal transduction histidine kinase
MFNRLRLKLTLTNILVIGLIFFIFMLGIFLIMREITHNQTKQMIRLISTNAGLNNETVNSVHDEHQYRYFYVILNRAGKIISATPHLDVKSRWLMEIVTRASASSKGEGMIETDDIDESYRFVKNRLQNGLGTSIIFVNTHSEYEMLAKLFIVLAFTGFCGLILLFFGSLYLADRSLIPIQEAMKKQRDFVADASHELRTPLSVIATTIDLLFSKRDQTVDSQLKWLENIQTENKRMTKLVNELLFLARTDSGQVMLEMKFFPVHSALQEAFTPFEAVAIQKGIYLKPFVGPAVIFWGDEARIKQLVVILVDNAIKHTPAGGEIEMRLRDTSKAIEISVIDTGEGIAPEHIDKIFRRFYRVEKSRSRKEGSVGLGLSIAEWIVKGHHGSIKVESTKNKRTTFCILLPKTQS